MKKNLCIILGILLVGSSFAKALETSVIGKKGSQNGTIFFAENGIYKEYMLLEEDILGKTAVEKYSLKKASEWHLPSREELALLHKACQESEKISFDMWVWSCNLFNRNIAYGFDFSLEEENCRFLESYQKCILVRDFTK